MQKAKIKEKLANHESEENLKKANAQQSELADMENSKIMAIETAKKL